MPCDAALVTGECVVNESSLTGEFQWPCVAVEAVFLFVAVMTLASALASSMPLGCIAHAFGASVSPAGVGLGVLPTR